MLLLGGDAKPGRADAFEEEEEDLPGRGLEPRIAKAIGEDGVGGEVFNGGGRSPSLVQHRRQLIGLSSVVIKPY